MNHQLKNFQKILLPTISVCAFIFFAGEVQAADYYVDGNLSADCTSGNYSIANRACNGSNGNAYNTITDVNSRLQPGDTAYIRAGTYAQQVAPANNGTGENARITYARYQSETVTLNWPASGINELAELNAKSYITINGVTFANSGNNWLDMVNSSHITIEKCTFNGIANTWRGVDAAGARYAILRNNNFMNAPVCPAGGGSCPADLVWFRGAGGGHNLIEGNSFGKTDHTALNAGEGTDRFIIRGNNFNNTWHHNMGLEYTNNPGVRHVVENNVIRNAGDECESDPRPSEACIGDSRFETYNTAGLAIGPSNGVIIRNNVLYNNGVALGNGASSNGEVAIGNRIYNNTFDQNERAIMNLSSLTYAEWSDNKFVNNIINRSTGEDGATGYGIRATVPTENAARDINFFINNNWYGNGSNLYKYITATDAQIDGDFNGSWASEFDGNIKVDPNFVKLWDRSSPNMTPDYTLQPTSPLIDAGAWLTTITSASSNGTSFTVADAGYFCDGWEIATGDVIKLANGQERTITAINYATNQITVNSSASWTQGMGVALDYEGTKPDIGAKEYGGGGTDTQAPGSPSGLNVR